MSKVSSIINSIKNFVYGFKKTVNTEQISKEAVNVMKPCSVSDTSVLPSGYIIRSRVLSRPECVSYLHTMASSSVYKPSTNAVTQSSGDFVVQKAEDAWEQVNKKRKEFIEAFNKKYKRSVVKGKNGSLTKITTDRFTHKVVRCFYRDPKGNISLFENY